MKDLIIQNITTWDKLKLNYWGIPKSANSSVKKKMIESSTSFNYLVDDSNYAYNHHQYHAIKNCKYITKEEAISNGFVNFTLVRNPYDRFISMFKDLSRRGNEYFYLHQNIKTVNDLISLLENANISHLNYHFRLQSSFVFINGKIAAEKVFKLEEIQNLELFLNLGKIDVINKIDEEILLTKDQKEKIYNIYHKDFKLFGYKK